MSFGEKLSDITEYSILMLTLMTRHAKATLRQPDSDDAPRMEAREQSAIHFTHSRRSYGFPQFEENPNILEGMFIHAEQPQEEDADRR